MSDTAYVSALPRCDFCLMLTDTPVPATYDAVTKPYFHHEHGMRPGSWAHMCEAHWVEHGTGRLGTGFGQHLVVGEKPEVSVKDKRAAIKAAIQSGDFDAAEDLIGDGDLMEWL